MLLTPEEINRLRDLVQLGALGTVEEDKVLARRGFVDISGRLTWPKSQAKERFYNRQGGVKGHLWKGSKMQFARWMRARKDTVVTRMMFDIVRRAVNKR